jgi:hypothetical protein
MNQHGLSAVSMWTNGDGNIAVPITPLRAGRMAQERRYGSPYPGQLRTVAVSSNFHVT